MKRICMWASMVAAVCCAGMAFGEAGPRTSEWNVLDFGAVADGVTDNTEAFQKALEAAGKANGGVVLAPTGRYSFSGSLVIPKEVTLRGVSPYSPSHAGIRDRSDEQPVFSTVLMPRANAGVEEGAPFVQLQTNATLQGLCVFYPDQRPEGPVPTPYPYAVALRGNNPALIDVELLNPYNGIDASQNQRALVRNIHGQPLHIGLYVDSIYDIGRIENVHWNPWWSMSKDLFEWQKSNGVGFLFGRTDWHYVLNTFCFGYNVGYKFIQTKSGSTNGNFLGIGADDCRTSVVIEQSAPMGILITNGEFVSIDGADPTMVRVLPEHKGTVRFVNCAFWGPCNRNAVIEGTGTIGFSDCTFAEWAAKDKTSPSIDAIGGSVLVRGCEFRRDRMQVRIGRNVERAIVTENLIRGKKQIENKSKGVTVVRDNAASGKVKESAKPKGGK